MLGSPMFFKRLNKSSEHIRHNYEGFVYMIDENVVSEMRDIGIANIYDIIACKIHVIVMYM